MGDTHRTEDLSGHGNNSMAEEKSENRHRQRTGNLSGHGDMYSQDRGPKRTRKMLTGHETFHDMKILNRTDQDMGILERPRLSRDEDTHRTEQLFFSGVRITHRQGNSQDAGIDTEQGPLSTKRYLQGTTDVLGQEIFTGQDNALS